MIKSYSASTREIDDASAAVTEIKEALDLENNLLTNSLGIVSCFSEFETTGVLKEICDALPFDCIGITSALCSVTGETDQIIFTITVLTSDDCEFKTSLIPIDEDYEKNINSSVSPLLKQCEKSPSLILGYFPLIHTIGGDMILAALDKATGGIPIFGTVAIDHTMDFKTSMTIYNGNAYREHAVLGAIYGEIDATYQIATLSEEKIRKQRAIITKSQGSLLISVNDKTVSEYLNEVGVSESDMLGIVPFVVGYDEGRTLIARAVYALTPEGSAACAGIMPEGATLSIGRIDEHDVQLTTKEAINRITDDGYFVLVYSCVARYFALGLSADKEVEEISKAKSDKDYHFAYSGGEICPVKNADGKLKNFYHNFTIVMCKIR